jgi:hypothetical protein
MKKQGAESVTALRREKRTHNKQKPNQEKSIPNIQPRQRHDPSLTNENSKCSDHRAPCMGLGFCGKFLGCFPQFLYQLHQRLPVRRSGFFSSSSDALDTGCTSCGYCLDGSDTTCDFCFLQSGVPRTLPRRHCYR